MARAHTGSWQYHVDDCRCSWADLYCNRDGWIWSCCGSTQKDSDCSGDVMHPTHWQHPKSSQTVDHYENNWPVHKPKEEIRKIAPECFDDED